MNATFLEILTATILVINFITVIVLIFFERKNPTTTVVWLFIFTFLPAIGFILYLFFGRGLKIRAKKDLIKKIQNDTGYDFILKHQQKIIEEQKSLLLEGQLVYNDSNMVKYHDIIRMNFFQGSCAFSQDNNITIFTHASEKYKSLIDDINNAKETINLVYFIIKNDNIGNRIVDALTEKSRQGVSVRLIYDEIGSFRTKSSTFNRLTNSGAKVYRFFPLKLGTILKANYRNHRKIVIIDGKIGYTGGMNIGDDYLGQDKRIKPWRDTHIRITGSAVHTLQTRFLKDWIYSSQEIELLKSNMLRKFFPPIYENGSIGMQIVSSGPDTEGEQIKRTLIKMIYSAKKKICIQTPYLIPDQAFLEALYSSALSGVEVYIMIPNLPDKMLVYSVTTSYIQELLEYGIIVYLYPGFLHAKMVVIDDELVTIGTTNIDIRSFSLHFEINAFIFDTITAKKSSEIFDNDKMISKLLTKSEYEKRSILKKILESIFRLFAPLM